MSRFVTLCVRIRVLIRSPDVKDVAHEILAQCFNIVLCEPLECAPFIAAKTQANLIISDSHGVQKKARVLGKPVLVLHDETERSETVEMDVVKMGGPTYEMIVKRAHLPLDDRIAYLAMARDKSPCCDGKGARRLVGVLWEQLA